MLKISAPSAVAVLPDHFIHSERDNTGCVPVHDLHLFNVVVVAHYA